MITNVGGEHIYYYARMPAKINFLHGMRITVNLQQLHSHHVTEAPICVISTKDRRHYLFPTHEMKLQTENYFGTPPAMDNNLPASIEITDQPIKVIGYNSVAAHQQIPFHQPPTPQQWYFQPETSEEQQQQASLDLTNK